MTDLKKIAAETHEAAQLLASFRIFTCSREKAKQPEGTDLFDQQIERLRRLATTLDALAAQSQEPVAWRWLYEGLPEHHSLGGSLCWDGAGPMPDIEKLAASMERPRTVQRFYAAPQPAPPQPAVAESFAKALHTFGEQFALARASVLSGNWTTDEQYDAAKSEVLRLYALAAGAAVKVPDKEWLVGHLFDCQNGHASCRATADIIRAEVLRLNAPEAGS